MDPELGLSGCAESPIPSSVSPEFRLTNASGLGMLDRVLSRVSELGGNVGEIRSIATSSSLARGFGFAGFPSTSGVIT